jgi:hypothetical protein
MALILRKMASSSGTAIVPVILKIDDVELDLVSFGGKWLLLPVRPLWSRGGLRTIEVRSLWSRDRGASHTRTILKAGPKRQRLCWHAVFPIWQLETG